MSQRKRWNVKLPWKAALLTAALAVVLAGCSTVTQPAGSEPPITSQLGTEPSSVKAGEEFTLVTLLDGAQSEKYVEVYFELKKDGTGDPILIKVEEAENNERFSGKVTLDEAGEYTVYTHIITLDLHLIEKDVITVGE